MEYIAPRNMTVTSISGRSAEFIKGEPLYCPPQMHAELISRGIVPVEAEADEVAAVSNEPRTAQEREAAIYAAYDALIERAERKEFTGTGAPHASAMAKQLGWEGFDAKERDATWAKYQADKAA